MQSAEAAWSAPTYGDVRHLEHALEAAVLAERPVQDRQHDLDVAERRRDLPGQGRQRRPGRSRRPTALPAEARWDVAGAERPAAVAGDLDRRDLVALRVEGVDHRLRGRDGDLVLRRAAAHEHRDPAAHHGVTVVSVVSGVVVAGGGVVERGTVSVVVGRVLVSTVGGGARVLADRDRHRRARLRSLTRPGRLGEDDAVLGRVGRVDHVDDHLEPGVPQRGDRVARGEARHVRNGGDRRALGDEERDRRARRDELFAHGSCWTTTPFGSFDSTSRRATANPAPWSVPAADSYGRADDRRDRDRLRPLRDVDPHLLALDSAPPRLRELARDRAGLLVGVDVPDVRLQPLAVSAATASVACWPTTSARSPSASRSRRGSRPCCPCRSARPAAGTGRRRGRRRPCRSAGG